MNESKRKICKIPKCGKETATPKAHFCLEHQRSVKEQGKAAGAVAGTLVVTGIGFLLSQTKAKK